ncbi:MAG TPA: class I adenylate-forming enzyme family protein [Steroidobacteraceae bacterium]|nr:class I adenylate-forming enzyme family protein [Steroidobacteraceae bacterium]
MALRDAVIEAAAASGGALIDAAQAVPLASLARGSFFGGSLEALRGRCVIVAIRDQLTAALALLELDGIARRMVLCTPDLPPEHLPHVARSAQADAWLGDAASSEPPAGAGLEFAVEAELRPPGGAHPSQRASPRQCDTEWVLLTSGTTGAPKLVAHTLASLTNAFISRADRPGRDTAPVWSTFYDIRRYGGLQIYLRGLYAGSLLLSSKDEDTTQFLARAAAAGVTHISGTPSHWRKALMSGAAARFSPAYVRLSGEIADQGILDALRAAFPRAVVAHAFASTEAGVGFEVRDGRAGFPASLIGTSEHGVELDVSRGTLRIKSPGNAAAYLGAGAPSLRDAEGFVDLGDRVELRDGRYHFIGRSGGIINVGGLKVHPEEVEAVINSHPRVRMSLVRARRSPITGAVVTAEVVLADGGATVRETDERVRQEILEACRTALAAHKVPAAIRFVPSLEMSASGKLVRPNESPRAIHNDTGQRVGRRESGGEAEEEPSNA